MINNNAKKWLRALRSGSYTQGSGGLHSIDQEGTSTFCCLGVACNLYLKGNDIQTRGGRPDYAKRQPVAYGDEYSYLPTQVADWLGLKSIKGTFVGGDPHQGIFGSLVELNDNGASFREIADVIEEREESLFHQPQVKWESRSSSGGE